MMGRMKFWFRLAILSSCIVGAWAQTADPKVEPTPAPSALNAVLFYQILLGELNVREGSPGAGFSMVLDAARKTRDRALFQRAVDIALQARSGDAALQAAQTWKRELPQATEPNRYILQILLALNRVEEAGQALSVSLHDLPASEQNGAIASVPPVLAPIDLSGHGAPALISNVYLEGAYSEIYSDISEDTDGMRRLFKQFSFPGGIGSHCTPETPGSIHEGGELGYSLSHAFGAVFDNPELIVACVIGDGEAETGPLATACTLQRSPDSARW